MLNGASNGTVEEIFCAILCPVWGPGGQSTVSLLTQTPSGRLSVVNWRHITIGSIAGCGWPIDVASERCWHYLQHCKCDLSNLHYWLHKMKILKKKTNSPKCTWCTRWPLKIRCVFFLFSQHQLTHLTSSTTAAKQTRVPKFVRNGCKVILLGTKWFASCNRMDEWMKSPINGQLQSESYCEVGFLFCFGENQSVNFYL